MKEIRKGRNGIKRESSTFWGDTSESPDRSSQDINTSSVAFGGHSREPTSRWPKQKLL